DALDGELVLVDGLDASRESEALEALAARATVVVLAHMVSAAFPGVATETREGERRALEAARQIIVTSEWTAAELVSRGLVARDRITVAVPGSREAGTSAPAMDGELLCVGVVARHKGQDILLEALAELDDQRWTCTIAGSTDTEPLFAAGVATSADRFGGRVRMPGVLGTAELDAAYRSAGLLVAPSRVESFGMSIADARRLGLPVIASRVGGIQEAVAGGGALLVRGDDAGALASALRRWMTDPALRERLRREASRARSSAPQWTDTVAHIHDVLVSA
ncbi:MAG: glycosyltransferase, partial [Frankiales bacterium]|nr:glycosyltransferase [Frankiales bacterium]